MVTLFIEEPSELVTEVVNKRTNNRLAKKTGYSKDDLLDVETYLEERDEYEDLNFND